MKLLLVLSIGLVLYVESSSAGMMDGLAGAMGVTITKECKKIMDEKVPKIKEKCWNFLKTECKNTKCKFTIRQSFKDGVYKESAKNIVKEIFNQMKKQIGLDMSSLPGPCPPLNKDVAFFLWGAADGAVAECVEKKGSPGDKIGDKEICKVTEKEMKPTMDCVKDKIMPEVMSRGMEKMDVAKKCANHIIKEYCTEKKMGKFMDNQVDTAMKDKNQNGKSNGFECVRQGMKTCKIVKCA